MASWKFVHAADLHLDSPLRGLARYEGAPLELMRASTRRALENIVDLCIEEKVKFLLLAGDIYDGDWKDFNTGLFFNNQMNRLGKAGIDVYMVRGNHDAVSAITKGLRLPSNVHEFSWRKAESFRIDELNVEIHGRSYGSKSMTDNIVLDYPQATSQCLNLGVLHTCLDGRPGHAAYAPCKPDELIAKGYDYWALGHVHDHQIVCEEPWILWSGTSQGRHAKEVGAKGSMLVAVEDQSIESVEFRVTDAVRWWRIDCDVSEESTAADIVERVRSRLLSAYAENGNSALAVRVRIFGNSDAHGELAAEHQRVALTNEIRALASEICSELWVEKVIIETQLKLDIPLLATRNDAVGGLLKTLGALQENTEGHDELLALFDGLRRKVPPDAVVEGELIGFESSEALAGLLADVEQLLVPMLVHANQEDET